MNSPNAIHNCSYDVKVNHSLLLAISIYVRTIVKVNESWSYTFVKNFWLIRKTRGGTHKLIVRHHIIGH